MGWGGVGFCGGGPSPGEVDGVVLVLRRKRPGGRGGGCWGLGCAWTGRSKGWGVPGVGKKTGRDGSACP